MKKRIYFKHSCFSFFAGVLNGFLGTGGGIPLYFGLSKEVADKKAYATASVGVMLLSLQTLFLYSGAATSPQEITPLFLHLAILGGTIGSLLLGRINVYALRIVFAVLLLVSGGYTVGKEIYLAFS